MEAKLSSKVMQLRFMQRAIEKKQQVETAKAAPEEINEVNK